MTEGENARLARKAARPSLLALARRIHAGEITVEEAVHILAGSESEPSEEPSPPPP